MGRPVELAFNVVAKDYGSDSNQLKRICTYSSSQITTSVAMRIHKAPSI